MNRYGLWLLVLCACDLTPSSTDTGETETEKVSLPIADIDWNSNQIVLTIEYGSGYDFEFGIVESWDGCQMDTVVCCTVRALYAEPHWRPLALL